MTISEQYSQAQADFLRLEGIAELDDQVTIMDEIDNFMANPTKKFAAGLYRSKIELWFREHGVTDETADIADRYDIF